MFGGTDHLVLRFWCVPLQRLSREHINRAEMGNLPRNVFIITICVALLLPWQCLSVKETQFYDTLGVPTDADEQLIKKAYRKAAL